MANNSFENVECISVRVPKRVIHCGDGIIEEFSDEETETAKLSESNSEVIDPKTLSWGPWMTHTAWSVGCKAVAACDAAGETLASFLGITTPKYQFEIEEYERIQEQQRLEAEQKKGWSEHSDAVQLKSFHENAPQPNQPEPVQV